MPLKSGQKNIGSNISEMEQSGHSKSHSVAAARHEAYDKCKRDSGYQQIMAGIEGIDGALEPRPNWFKQ